MSGQKRSEEELFSYLRNEIDKRALEDGRRECATAAEGNAKMISAIKGCIEDEPGIETAALVAYVAKRFEPYGGPYVFEPDQMLLMWSVALVELARRELTS